MKADDGRKRFWVAFGSVLRSLVTREPSMTLHPANDLEPLNPDRNDYRQAANPFRSWMPFSNL
jgi:hypothetical protein